MIYTLLGIEIRAMVRFVVEFLEPEIKLDRAKTGHVMGCPFFFDVKALLKKE